MKSTPLARLTAMSAILTLGGCGVKTQTMESIREVVQTVQGTAAAVSPATTTIPASPQISYDPPYPDRVDPFSFPAGFGEGGSAELTSPTMMQVRVLGFADVEEPRVFLRIRETTRALKVGDSIDGIEVLAIKAPTVDLRMGSLAWTATMFDQAAAPATR